MAVLSGSPVRGYMSVANKEHGQCRAIGTEWEQLKREQVNKDQGTENKEVKSFNDEIFNVQCSIFNIQIWQAPGIEH